MFQDSQKAPNVVASQHPLFPPSNLVGEVLLENAPGGICTLVWDCAPLDLGAVMPFLCACHAAAATDFSRPVPGGSTEL